ncbi:hypothetical protein SDC9_201924 [bioreactor metagenome]|uniref:Uncharacterized protein n=1 Tax=bioreactor metagenome TaxID=1076179 RepID=A0A645J181_9ZZZZ
MGGNQILLMRKSPPTCIAPHAHLFKINVERNHVFGLNIADMPLVFFVVGFTQIVGWKQISTCAEKRFAGNFHSDAGFVG